MVVHQSFLIRRQVELLRDTAWLVYLRPLFLTFTFRGEFFKRLQVTNSPYHVHGGGDCVEDSTLVARHVSSKDGL